MKGDFSRNTFDAKNHFSRVLMQQGRVQLDADWNEQAAIQLHRLQSLATDLIGPHGGPDDANLGFGIVNVDDLSADEEKRLTGAKILPLTPGDFLIGKGRYYVDGVLCENEDFVPYLHQRDFPDPTALETSKAYLVYLDVWERHLTYVEQEDADGSVISIRESALGGPDTATRTKVVWQVKTQLLTSGTSCDNIDPAWSSLVQQWQPEDRGCLKAIAVQPKPGPGDPCAIPPEARYRGAENQLYRVEIHKSGKAGEATFKWSRENGSVIFPIRQLGGNSKIVTLENLRRDPRFGLQVGDWVEIVDDDYTLHNRAEPLLQVDAIDFDANIVTLKDTPTSTVGQDSKKHPFLRRWDQRKAENSEPSKDGVLIKEGSDWIELEDSVQIQFQLASSGPANQYRSGDYWLIPARTATGDVEWPGPVGHPDALPPHGVQHHYAPLWIIPIGPDGKVTADPNNDCRHKITGGLPASELTPDEKAALDAAHRPNQSNPFATLSDLPAVELNADQRAALDAAHRPNQANPFATLNDLPGPQLTADQLAAVYAASNPGAANPFATRNELLGGSGFGKVQQADVTFSHSDPTDPSGRITRTVPVGFQPVLVLATGGCWAKLGTGNYGGTISAIANLQGGAISAHCSALVVTKGPTDIDELYTINALGLYLGLITDKSIAGSIKSESLTINITAVDSTGFTVTFERALAGTAQLDQFVISLSLYCFG
jgi:hypothetical protein